MHVKLNAFSEHLHTVTIRETELLFSYETLVGVRLPNGHRYRTDRFHSVTTSKHLNQAGYGEAPKIDQPSLEAFANGAVPADA